MNYRHLSVFLATGCLAWASASAFGGDTFVETFDDGLNEGGWQWGTGNEQIVPVNGHPGAHLQDLTINSCCPVVFTAPGLSSEFTGDYRQRGVISVAVDLITLDADFSVANRPLTLMLINNNVVLEACTESSGHTENVPLFWAVS